MIKTLFTDIGGVLLTNGWDTASRNKAMEKFDLLDEKIEISERHHLCFDTYEMGKTSLDEYLDKTFFCRERKFSKKEFKDFMFEQSKPYNDMLSLVSQLKQKFSIKTAVISNEGKELNNYRIKKFGLGLLIDAFISSSYVHLRKPDEDIFKMALEIMHCQPHEAVYIEDRLLFVEIANKAGMQAIHHIDYESTKNKLSELNLNL
ncbi:HAD family phosphatase [soil metagenome]